MRVRKSNEDPGYRKGDLGICKNLNRDAEGGLKEKKDKDVKARVKVKKEVRPQSR